MDKVIRHGLEIAAGIDKASQKEMRQVVRDIFVEESHIDFNNPENVKGLRILADMMKKMFQQAGNTKFDFSKMIELPGPELFDGLKEAAMEFDDVWSNIVQKFGKQSLKDVFMKDQSDLSMALSRLTDKEGKLVKNRIKNIEKAFKEIKLTDINKLLNEAMGAETEFRNAESWEEQTAAALRYLNVYEKILKVKNSGNFDVADIERQLIPVYKNIDKLGSYAVSTLKDVVPQMQTSLQNIFNLASGKPLIGLTDGGKIDFEVVPTVIKTLDVGDVLGGKANLEIPVVFKTKLDLMRDLSEEGDFDQLEKLQDEIVSMFPEGVQDAVLERLEKFAQLEKTTARSYQAIWKDLVGYGMPVGDGEGGFGTGTGTGSGDTSLAELEAERARAEALKAEKDALQERLQKQADEAADEAYRHQEERAELYGRISEAEESADMYRRAMDSMQEEMDAMRGQSANTETSEVDKFNSQYGDLAKEFGWTEQLYERFNAIMDEVRKGSLSAADAVVRLREEMANLPTSPKVASPVIPDTEDILAEFKEGINPDDADDIGNIEAENGVLEDRLELLREISDQYGAEGLNKDAKSYYKLWLKEMDGQEFSDNQSDRYSEASENLEGAAQSLVDFEKTYDKIVVKFAKGKDLEILPNAKGLEDLAKIANEYGESYNGKEIVDVEFVRKEIQARQENVVAINSEIEAIKNKADAYDHLYEKIVQSLEKNNDAFSDYEELIALAGQESLDEYRNSRSIQERARLLLEEGYIEQQTFRPDDAEGDIVESNEKKIESYEELSAAVSRYIELAKSLVDTEKNTSEHEQIKKDMDAVDMWGMHGQEDYINAINEWQRNIVKIKAAMKAGADTYRTDDGYVEQITDNSLAQAEARLRGYIYQYVENFDDIDTLLAGAKTKALQNIINKEIGKFTADQDIQRQQEEIAEAANAAALAEMEQIEDLIEGSAPTEKFNNVFDTLGDLKYRAHKVDRYTQSSVTDNLADDIGIISPHKEIENNAKAIKSYEDLCDVIARYNELRERRVVYGGGEYPTLSEDEENEFAELTGRLNATRDGVKVTWRELEGDINKLAQLLGIEIPQAAQQAQQAVGGLNGELKTAGDNADNIDDKIGGDFAPGAGTGQIDGATSEEVENLEKVRQKVSEITNEVKEKTQEFLNEQTAVKKAAQSEVHALSEVEKKVNAIRVALSNVNTLLNNIKKGKDIGAGLGNININVNHKKDEKKKEPISINQDSLKSVLENIVYKVKIDHDDNDKQENKIAIDAEALEGVLRRVFADKPGAEVAVGAQDASAKAQTDGLVAQYKRAMSTIAEWQTLYQSLNNLPYTNKPAEQRKNILNALQGVTPELAHMIGGAFEEAFKAGFKGFKTKDITRYVSRIAEESLFGSVPEQVEMLRGVDVENFDFDKLPIQKASIDSLNPVFELLHQIDAINKGVGVSGLADALDGDPAEQPKESYALEKTLLDVKGVLDKIAKNTASLNGVEIQRAVEANTNATEQVAPAVAAEVNSATSESKLGKVAEKYRSDKDKVPLRRVETENSKTSKSYRTTKTHKRPIVDDEGNWAGDYDVDLVEVIDDYDKIRKENDKTQKAVERAQKKVAEFVAKFQSKTGGNAQYVEGFSDLQAFAVPGAINAENINDAYNQMILLQQKYAELEANFRKGQTSLNPFVNAINKSQNIGNIFGEVQDKFDGLVEKSDTLTENFNNLKSLAEQIQAFTKRMETDPASITPTDFTEFSRQMGEFTSLKTQVDSMIRSERAAEKEASAKSAERTRQIKSISAEYEKLGQLRAKFEGSGDLEDREELKILAEQVAKKRESLELTTDEIMALRQKSEEAYQTEQRLINAAKEQKAFDDQKNAAEASAKKTDAEKEARLKKVVGLEKEISVLRAEFDTATNAGVKNALEAEIRLREELIEKQRQGLEIDEEIVAYDRQMAANRTKQARVNATQETKARKDVFKEAEKEAKKQAMNAKRLAQREAMIGKAGNAVGRAENTWMTAIGVEDKLPKEFMAQIDDYYQKLDALRKKHQELKNSDMISEEQKNDLLAQTMGINKMTDEIGELVAEYQRLSGDNVDKKKIKATTLTSNSPLSDYEAELRQYVRSIEGGNAQIKNFDATTKTLTYTVKTGKNEFTEYTAAVRRIDGALVSVQGTTKRTETFLEATTRKMKELTSYMSGMALFSRVTQELRKGIQYVREIDLALTELKKVTDETEETYDKFLDTAAKTGARLGTTISAVTEATATFAKLGYSMEQATEMAEAAIVYKNVGDNIESTGDAADSIISTMKGFRLEVTESMAIVDRFNEVGNKFAITSQGIGEALRLSASALSEGGNSLDESIGLITAANEVVNDPSSVGTALKTLTLRLRGSKTELEEMGEDVTDMATTTSQLQAKLLALTGGQVDIMLDENTFKNSTQILREMADAWEDMNDIQRAEWCPYVQKCA